MTKLTTKKLDFWINHNLNVLFIGNHGVGKSTIILDTFNRHNLKYKYFSAATMDPWVDFIGVPKEKNNEQGESYLELIQPAEFRDDAVEILFFDEFNRAPPKIRNAVMELIQFKSINGRKFKNLRAVWAAINPYDEEETYNVEQLDPAQQDRFHIIYTLPSTPDKTYFTTKYGITVAERAISWWDMLPDKQKTLISPRRLDYALDIYLKGGDIVDVLDRATRPGSLKRKLEVVETTNMSHQDWWLQDGETYLNEISSRASKIDVVKAFSVLKELSLDQAISYVHQLPPTQLKQLAQSNDTCYLVLRALQDNPSSARKVKDAIKKIKTTDPSWVSTFISTQMKVCQQTCSVLYSAVAKCGQNANKTASWISLKNVLNTITISHNNRILLMVCCLDRLPTKPISSTYSNKIITSVSDIICKLLRDEYDSDDVKLLNLISIDPSKVAFAIERATTKIL